VAGQAEPPSVSVTRPPRVVPPASDEVLDLPDAPRRPQPRQFPRVALLAPVALGLTMYAVTGRLISLVFVAMAPLMMVGSYVDTRVSARRLLGQQTAEFRRALDLAVETMTERHERERTTRSQRHPAVADVMDSVRDRGPLLWTHRPEHEAFLTVRIGLGSSPARATATVSPMRDAVAETWKEADAVRRRFASIDGVPVTADLRSAGAVGVAGAAAREGAAGSGGEVARADAVARAVLLQLAGLHSPQECVIAGFVSPAEPEAWRWLEWLPHTSSPASPLSAAHVVVGAVGAEALVGQLEALVSHRAGEDIEHLVPVPRGSVPTGAGAEAPSTPAIVVLVCDDAAADRARLIRLAERGADVNVHVIWVAASPSRVPAACRTVVVVDAASASVGHVREGATSTPVDCDTVTVAQAAAVARQLCCLEDVGAVDTGDAAVPRSVSFLDLHGSEALDPRRAGSSWSALDRAVAAPEHGPVSRRPFTLRALVGHDGSEPFYLDLISQGPHALVGGTTGAGKSEFLQSWILAMATAHSPARVTFLLVDYKGGSAFAECTRLPHSVGLVTDLAPHLVDRALASLRAELRMREQLLARKGAKDLKTLVRAGDPEAPPSLVIVVDEFAALVQEVPAFVDGVVDIAQRGRSLGLHLILATQRPAGVIKDSLRANTNLRIALRMADEPDSVDVLGVADAAHVDPALPGRAMARTGPGRVASFQAAFAGAHSTAEPATPAVAVRELHWGEGRVWESPGSAGAPVAGETDAARMVGALTEAARRLSVPPPRRPWLDELAPTYDLLDLARRARPAAAFGLEDDPARQSQGPVAYDPDREGTLLVLGGSGSGTSTALRSIALGETLAAGRAPVHIYGIDRGGGGLDMLRSLPNVADVVHVEDAERIARMMTRLCAEVETRVRRATAVRASSLDDLREGAGDPGLPRLLVLIDGFGAFQAGYLDDVARHDVFRRLVTVMSEGRSVGVHVALAADRLRALVGRTLVLRLNDEAQYGLVGLRGTALSPSSPPGRGCDAATRREFQVGVLGGDPSVRVQALAVDRLAAELRARGAVPAAPIPRLPAVVRASSLPADVVGLPVLGIDAETLEPRGFEVERPIAIAGQPGTGRSTALAWMATAIRRAHPARTLVLLTQRRTRIGALRAWDAVHQGPNAADELLERWRERLEQAAHGDDSVALCIENVQDFGGGLGDGALLQAVKGARRQGHLIIGEAETQAWAVGALASEIRSARRGLILAPEGADCQMLFGVQAPRAPRGPVPPGRGLWVEAGRVATVHMPWPDGEFSTDPTAGLPPVVAPR
uniref:FtsK/SpoIIIE domain-containing protein n=1 Tax=uncultured Demequina sp. TaxID=693499 RepID=UPI0025D79940